MSKNKVTFSRIGEYGRLGNQLWQYAFLKAYSEIKKDKVDVYLPNLEKKEWHGQKCLLNNFNISIPQIKERESNIIYNLYFEKNAQYYDENLYNYDANIDFIGFFQNMNYFKNYQDIIKEDLTFIPEIEKISNEIISSYKNKYKKQIVSIHVRRGDLAEQVSELNFYGDDDSIYSKYIKKALNTYFYDKDKFMFIIFTGGSRNNNYKEDYEWCKNNILKYLEGYDYELYTSNDSMLDFSLITKCDHNIMCHSSTFSWWACYLNKNKNKIVIAPKFYFIENQKLFYDNFYPDDFILI